MDTTEALLALKLLSKEEFAARMSHKEAKKLGLSLERQELLFSLIQGETTVSISCQPDIEAFLLKTLSPEIYWDLPREAHPYSSGERYEYDPAKNGQNMIKHGIGFGEVVSYSSQFGALSVALSCEGQGERLAIFSDLNLMPRSNLLELPPRNAKTMNTVMSIVQLRDYRFRFISSRLLSPDEKAYRKDIGQALRKVLPDPELRKPFVDRCVEILKENLIKPADAVLVASPDI